MATSTNEVGFRVGPALPSPANAGYPLYSWVGWSNVSKVSCSRKHDKQHCLGIEPGSPGSYRLIPNHQAVEGVATAWTGELSYQFIVPILLVVCIV